jgi:hypothetical protein
MEDPEGLAKQASNPSGPNARLFIFILEDTNKEGRGSNFLF